MEWLLKHENRIEREKCITRKILVGFCKMNDKLDGIGILGGILIELIGPLDLLPSCGYIHRTYM